MKQVLEKIGVGVAGLIGLSAVRPAELIQSLVKAMGSAWDGVLFVAWDAASGVIKAARLFAGEDILDITRDQAMSAFTEAHAAGGNALVVIQHKDSPLWFETRKQTAQVPAYNLLVRDVGREFEEAGKVMIYDIFFTCPKTNERLSGFSFAQSNIPNLAQVGNGGMLDEILKRMGGGGRDN